MKVYIINVEESWKHLKDYHDRFTKQRTDAFNFSLILLGLILGAIVTLSVEAWKYNVQQPHWIFGIILFVLAIFVIVAAIIFYGVDYRTTCFLKAAEKQLQMHEEKIDIVSNGNPKVVLEDVFLPFTIDKDVRGSYEKMKKKHIYAKFGTLIKFTYIGFVIIGILSIAEAIFLFIFLFF